MSYVVTGGCGFIGSNFVNYLCDTTDSTVFVIDKMTYAANESNIDLEHYSSGQVRVYKCDLAIGCDALDKILEHNEVNGIFHFAAESHVDNSIAGPRIFVDANVVGTFNLLEKCLKHNIPRFLQVSTDEVYGALTENGPSFTEGMRLDPNNVYSATKASADLLVRSFHKTYGLNVVTTRCCNNYGPRQDSEKLIPKVICNALNNVTIPVYGKGVNVREWIHVFDHCTAIKAVFDHGQTGDIYNIGSGVEVKNLDLVKRILKIVGRPAKLIKFVKDRAGHDFRYSIDCSKFEQLVTVGETPDEDIWTLQYGKSKFNEGLEQTVKWYKETLT
jgi:dTDP-glucose 4,6-dehydratase